ncbi:hydrogenase maturation protease [Nitrospira sp. CMX1]
MCDGPPDKRGEKHASDESRKSRLSSIRIIGLGNEFRGDDAVGLLAARRIRERIGSHIQVVEAESAGVELLDLMKDAHTVFLIDALCSGKVPGTIHRLDVLAGPIASNLFPRSSHAIGVGEVLELARTLGVLPATVIVYGIEVGNTELGQPLSSSVAKALDQVVDQIVQEREACRA